jgi:class 3 adenylate cyclase/tetratricopeptide (TPR) repeat protein
VPICTSCGSESEHEFVFCPDCGARRVAAKPTRELRKTVTVLFCDIMGSTSIGENIDPEALRSLLARYFWRMKEILELHGGTVEKFAGDAVMAVFGVPALHEDDALRAVRAAAEMSDAVNELGLQVRIGVNTGEVVTGTEERLATGDAVNVAARLEQAAAPGEVLLGEETVKRVRDAVDAEQVGPLMLKGKSEPVFAYRVLSVREAPPRRFGTRMVGRENELRILRDAFARAASKRSCQLFTVLGTAGVGKSRLAAEFVRGIDARVVSGRCLSYGQGITYRPLVELLTQLDELPPDDAAAASLRSLLGESAAATSADEIAWASRKLLEHAARERPLVCVLEDLHWAEEKFLDLLEHVAVLARDAPILLLCTARPELLDGRPGWGTGMLDATTTLLEPLNPSETDRLLDALGGVREELRDRISAAAEGNPLFLEEMVALVRESDDDDDATVPPTIQALLAARLEQLDPAERSVLERGAVEGRVFHRSAVQALDEQDSEVSVRLVSLVRKDLVQPEPTQLLDDDAYRFRHLLIRDAAYDALSKAVRATLHERVAGWLEARPAGFGDVEELVGHHLEQAARYKQDLGRPDEQLAERAGELVAAAGRRALWRGDTAAAAGLLVRAIKLLPASRADVSLRLDLASAQPTPQQAAVVAHAAAEHARANGDTSGEATARVVEAFNGLLGGDVGVDELDELTRAALPPLEEAADHDGLVRVWSAIGYGVANLRCQFAEWAWAAEQALVHARLSGQRPTHLFSLEVTLVCGPMPAGEAVALLDSFLPELPHPYPLLFRSHLQAMLGRFDEAWPSAREASARLRELTGGADGGEYALAEIASLAGDQAAAAEHLRGFCQFLDEHGQHGLLSTFAPMLGRALCAVGRYDDAEPQAQIGRELGEEHDVATQALWRQVQALVASHRGQHADAEALARDAVSMIEQTDALNYQGAALVDLADVLRTAGRGAAAAEALDGAIACYERKENLAAAEQARARLAALRTESPAVIPNRTC